jgi:hypothetical protein
MGTCGWLHVTKHKGFRVIDLHFQEASGIVSGVGDTLHLSRQPLPSKLSLGNGVEMGLQGSCCPGLPCSLMSWSFVGKQVL